MLVSEIKKINVVTPSPLRDLLSNIFGDGRQIETFVAPVQTETVDIEEPNPANCPDPDPVGARGVVKRSIALFGVIWLSIYIQRYLTFNPMTANAFSALLATIMFISLDRFLL